MATIGMGVDITALVDATGNGDSEQIIAVGRDLLRRGASAAELLGRVGMIAAHGDESGNAVLTLSAATTLSRWIEAVPRLLEQDEHSHEAELPLLVQALSAAAPAVRAGKNAQYTYPEPLFPSQLQHGQEVTNVMHDAVYGNDTTTVERLLFGLYGTGADYRTMEIRTYDGIATTFQDAGHPLMFAVRGFQLLDAAEWGDQASHILHWLAPHLPLHSKEPTWVKTVRQYVADPTHSTASLRTRLSPPKDVNALPLRALILSDADTPQVCQGVYNALMRDGASTHAAGSVIALAASDLLKKVGDTDREAFVHAAHGLLFAAAVRLVFTHVQDMDAVPLLFTSASLVNTLQKEPAQHTSTPQPTSTPSNIIGGGLIAPSLLETLRGQLQVQDVIGGLSTARRYLKLGYDARALFAAIGLVAAQADAAADHGHTWQIIQAAGEEFIAWPPALADTNVDGLLQVALRAASFAQRNTLVSHLF